MKSLTALSKYLGCYDRWNEQRKRYNLKWTTGSESIQSLQRFFDPGLSLDIMLQRIREMIRVLPEHMGKIIKFACMIGLRPSEVVECVRLLNYAQNSGHNYYNQERQCLEHFRFSQFLRTTKKAYISFITPDNLQPIATLGSNTPLPGTPSVWHVVSAASVWKCTYAGKYLLPTSERKGFNLRLWTCYREGWRNRC